jgi:hypothetical protein
MEFKVEQEQAKASTIVSGVHGAFPHTRRVKARSGPTDVKGVKCFLEMAKFLYHCYRT